MDDRNAQSGYYREIARAFLGRRGGALVLSPKDQAAIAVWEEKRVPLSVVLEGVGRTFDVLKARGRNTRTISLAFCDREVEAAFAQHRDRAAGRRKDPESAPRPDKKDKARREAAAALAGLPAGDAGVGPLLRSALEALAAAEPDEAALERIDAGIDEVLWTGATEAERAEAASETRKSLKGRTADRAHVPGTRPPAGLEDVVRRRVIMSARARRRIPHVSLHYH